MTTSKSLKKIFIIWFISAAFATYAATPDSGSSAFLAGGVNLCLDYDSGTKSKRKGYGIFLCVSVVYLPAIVILITYTLIFVVAHKRQKMLRNGELGQTCTVQNQKSALRHDQKIVRMLLVVVGVFFICWLPYSINFFLMYYNHLLDFKGWNYSRSIFTFVQDKCFLFCSVAHIGELCPSLRTHESDWVRLKLFTFNNSYWFTVT